MPIQDKDLGKYKAPSIYIEEKDNSIIELPVQDVLINLVPGFSKKGPKNNPIYLEDPVTFKRIFGDIDRSLENKNSYFHRTCLRMLDSGPIYALSLLSTDPERDLLQWKSISLQAKVDNAATQTEPYENFFNRQNFWKRDEDSFLDIVNHVTVDSDRLLHLTNMGDKTLTAFIFKSTSTSFDITAENWYGGAENVPDWMNKTDWISDYLVTVLIIAGDWTKYNELAVHTTWSQYFTTDGLDKTKVETFVNETDVNVLGNYDVSLIPYFKDLNGADMYIRTKINNNTDTSGLFSAFYEDGIMSSSYPIGKVDIIGDGLVEYDKTEIDFLSYNNSISEIKTYEEKKLNSASNVFGNYSTDLTSDFGSVTDRDANYTNYYVHSYTSAASSNVMLKLSSININNFIEILTGYTSDAIPANGTPISFSTSFEGYAETIEAGVYYYIQNKTATVPFGFTISKDVANVEPLILASGVTVSSITATVNSQAFAGTGGYFNINGVQTYLTGDTLIAYNEPFTISSPTDTYSRYDVYYLTKGSHDVHVLTGTQAQEVTSGVTALKPDFPVDSDGLLGDKLILGYGLIKYYSTGSTNTYYQTQINSGGYIPLTGITITTGTTSGENYIGITFLGTAGATDATNYDRIVKRTIFNDIENGLNDGKAVIIHKTTGEKLPIPTIQSASYSTSTDAWIKIYVGTNNPNKYFDSATYFLIYYVDDEFVIDSTNATTKLITSYLPLSSLITTSGSGIAAQYSSFYEDFRDGIINTMDYFYVSNNTGSTKVYLKMFLDSGNLLWCEFLDVDKESTKSISGWAANYGSELLIHSNKSNWKQTVEIEYVDTSKLPDDVWSIKVDKTRFSEVKKGSFLEAYYVEADYEAGGSKYGQTPKKLTRIVSTSIDASNSSWKILNTDAPIKITNRGTTTVPEYQTTVYSTVDIYVDYYKGIKLDPFTIHADSIPDGTESRQSDILDVLTTTANLGKALADKNQISWRYLVDSFGLGLTAESKQQYVDLCGLKLNCLGFINMPSVKSFKKSADPSFVDDTGALSTYYVMKGANDDLNPSFYYSFGDGVGRSCVGYFFPYVRIDDEGVPKYVPPAAYVATSYMNKFTTSNAGIVPWTIVAGIDVGRVGVIGGTEMDFNFEDLENLSQMGSNPIVYKKDRGYCINDENSAQIFPYSSLSLIHTREVLIELENRLYDMLLRYQWKFNTPEIRSEIKFRADKICKELKDANGLYDYRNIMDTTNNTNYIIDLQMGVLDTYIEVIKGMGVIVNNITILKKGDIQSGGFV